MKSVWHTWFWFLNFHWSFSLLHFFLFWIYLCSLFPKRAMEITSETIYTKAIILLITRSGVIEPLNKGNDCALSRATGTNHCHCLPSTHWEAQIFKDHIGSWGVSKADLTKLNFPCHLWQNSAIIQPFRSVWNGCNHAHDVGCSCTPFSNGTKVWSSLTKSTSKEQNSSL